MTQSHTVVVDTERLVRDAQAGDARARDDLITGHVPLIYNIVGRALNGHPDVDDVVQESMLRAIRGLPALREPDRFRSWLVTIAYRQIQLYLRSRSAVRLRRAPAPPDVPDPAGDFAERTTAELVVADQRRELVEAARWLDDGDRRLLALWWQEASGDLTRSELAAALAVQPKHAAVRVQRMKAQLDAARGVVRAVRARPRCPELGDRLRRWNGIADPLWRKRLARHVRECPQCGPHAHGLVAPEHLLLGMAALPVPAVVLAGVHSALHTKVTVSATGAVLAQVQGLLQHKVLAVTATAAVATGGLTYAVYQTPDDGPPKALPTAAATTPAATRSPAAAPSRTATPTARPVVGTGVRKADIYVAPGGSDAGDGSAARPYATVRKAVAVVRPGQTIALRGGTYRSAEPILINTDGTAAKRIVLSNYRDEKPVIDASGLPAGQWAITQRTAYWTVQGLQVRGSKSHAYVCESCRDTVLQRLSLHGNVRSGLMLRGAGTTRDQVLDNDFFDNHDPAGAGAIGTGLIIGAGSGEGVVVRGNRSYHNAATGYDLGSFAGAVTLDHNWSYGNGVNRWNSPAWRFTASGFILGGGSPRVPAAHRLRENAAWDNTGHGFTDEGNTAAIELTGNTAFRNRETGFALFTAAATLRDNVAIGNASPVDLGPRAHADGNSWQLRGWSAAKFRSTDASVAQGPRTPAGRLPGTDFLRTGTGIGASMTAG